MQWKLKCSKNSKTNEMPSKQKKKASSETSRVQWNEKMDEHLIYVLKEEHLGNGRNLDGTWKTEALHNAVEAVFDNTGVVVKLDHVRARKRYLQKNYKKAKDCKEKNGFGWSPVSKMFTADPLSWKEFVEAHPEYRKYCTKAVPFFDDLDVIFGKEKVTGLRSFEGSEAPAHLEIPQEIYEVESIIEVSAGSANSHGERSRKRRRVREHLEETSMLKGIVDAAREVAAALRQQKCDKIEKALKDLPDMSEDNILDGMDLLGPYPQLAEVFFGFSEKVSRKAWLLRRLNRRM